MYSPFWLTPTPVIPRSNAIRINRSASFPETKTSTARPVVWGPFVPVLDCRAFHSGHRYALEICIGTPNISRISCSRTRNDSFILFSPQQVQRNSKSEKFLVLGGLGGSRPGFWGVLLFGVMVIVENCGFQCFESKLNAGDPHPCG